MSKPVDLTEKESQNIRYIFELFDKNKDGFISRSELRNGYFLLVNKLDECEPDVILNEYDDNDDGKLDFDEFTRLYKEAQFGDLVNQIFLNNENQDQLKEDLKKIFDLNDKDHDGSITRDELKYVFQELATYLRYKKIDNMIEKADINKDGKIDFEGKEPYRICIKILPTN
ncbi:unnamed protein product [Brachionus calyciflorus]|uniref:EF-hand domain-containing protein n=1 Tax=Brachionus calyciflorus TaxID=104777 RepID=A0A814A3K2_9BILA|nr:unnamed protein product [Brachionus calyciflorus]